MNKKKIFSCVILASTIVLGSLFGINKVGSMVLATGNTADYNLIFDKSTRKPELSSTASSGNYQITTDGGNPLTITYTGIKVYSRGLFTLEPNGTFYNAYDKDVKDFNAIDGLTKIEINASDTVNFLYGYEPLKSVGDVKYSTKTVTLDNNVITFTEDFPSYFKIQNALQNPVNIKSIILTYSCQRSENPDLYKNWKFTRHNYTNYYSISYKNKNNGVTEITEFPRFYMGLPVKELDDNAFKDCKTLKNIVIPPHIKYLGDMVFDGCTNLTNVTIPSTVTRVGNYVFSGCTGFTSYNWPTHLDSIAIGAFHGCTNLTDIHIPSTVQTIGSYAFSGCTSLTHIDIPDTVTTLGQGAFEECSSLLNLVLPKYITKLYPATFARCSLLTSVTIPVGLTFVDNTNFYQTYSLSHIYYEGTQEQWKNIDVSSVDNNYLKNANVYFEVYSNDIYEIKQNEVFKYQISNGNDVSVLQCLDKNITSIDIGEMFKGYNVVSLGTHLFSGFKQLTSIVIPDSVTLIGSYAFNECSALTNVKLPKNINCLKEYTFYMCTSLEKVLLPSTITGIGAYCFSHCTSLRHIVIPASTESIDLCAFKLCTSLVSVTIPLRCTYIASYAFGGCPSLKLVIYAGDDQTWRNNVTIESDNSDLKNMRRYNMDTESPFELVDDGQRLYIQNEYSAVVLEQKNKAAGYVNFTIPGRNLKGIIDNACNGMPNLTSIIIPSGIVFIGQNVFEECPNMTQVYYGGTFTEFDNAIDGSTFPSYDSYRVHQLDKTTSYFETKTNSKFKYQVSNNKDVIICECLDKNIVTADLSKEFEGYNIVAINLEAFKDCNLLTTVYIPYSVNMIGANAFRSSPDLTIYCEKNKFPRWKSGWVGSDTNVVYKYIRDPLFNVDVDNSEKIILLDYKGATPDSIVIPSIVTGRKVVTLAPELSAKITGSLYFEGNQADWEAITHTVATNVDILLYSETEPSPSNRYFYWHYNANHEIVEWNV